MQKPLEPVNLGTVTPLRRVRSVRFETVWDESLNPPGTRIAASFEYELIYPGGDGKQVCPPRQDGAVILDDAQCRALPDFAGMYDAIARVAHAVKENPPAPVG